MTDEELTTLREHANADLHEYMEEWYTNPQDMLRLLDEIVALRQMLREMVEVFEIEVPIGNPTIARAASLLGLERREDGYYANS